MIYFTADHHFGHSKIIKYADRPFSSVSEMDRVLIEHWNSVVGEDDVVFHLGDFTLGGSRQFRKYVSQLNGRIKFVPGGHDLRWVQRLAHVDPVLSKSSYVVEILPPLFSLEVPEINFNGFSMIIVLCHYALRVWDRSYYGSWHLYGHSHGTLPPYGLSFDVGVDSSGFTPWSLFEVQQYMEKLNVEAI